MKIERCINTKINIKKAFIEMGELIDEETGEILNLTDIISKVYGEQEVKITIAAISTEDVDIESVDSEE